MAKIKSVKLNNIPKEVAVGEEKEKVNITTHIEFNTTDLKLEMEYMLYLFIYDVNVKRDTPVLIPNWDESYIKRFNGDSISDDFISDKNVLVKAVNNDKGVLEINTKMQLKLGKLGNNASRYERSFNVFATLIPAINIASKWSDTVESELLY